VLSRHVAVDNRAGAFARANRGLGGRLAAVALLSQRRIAVGSHEGEHLASAC
jgi:hypothetical protein